MHVEYGLKILGSIKQLDTVVEIIKCHHERYDGTGYPYQLKGEAIPIGSRIIALADTFDALVSSRSYRNSISVIDAIEIIKEQSGKQLDYNVVQAFLKVVDKFEFDEE